MNSAEPIDWPASVAATRRLSRAGHVPHPGSAQASLVSSGDIEAQVAEFTAACELVGGQVHHIANAADVATFVASLCAPPLDPRVLVWAPEHLPLTGVHEAMLANGLELLSDVVRTDAAGHEDDLARLDTAVVGVTSACAVLADTGSVVVMSGSGRSRLASLLPPIHVALVTRAQIVPSLGAWLAANPTRPTEVANCVVITGPSRTADIEMTLTRGVHGPRLVHIVFTG